MAVATAMVAPAAGVAHASGHVSPQTFKPRFTINNANLGTGGAAGLHKTLASFHDSFQAGGQDYGYYMVGADPFTTPNKSTTVNTLIIPINVNLESGNGGGDYNASGIVGDLLGSPLYQNYHFASGHTQLLDANQRAEFWSAIDDNYHLLLNPTVAAPVTINVPAGQGEAITTGTGVTIADVSFAFWTSALKTVSAQTSGIQADMLPVFLTKDTYLYFGPEQLLRARLPRSLQGPVEEPADVRLGVLRHAERVRSLVLHRGHHGPEPRGLGVGERPVHDLLADQHGAGLGIAVRAAVRMQ